MNDFLLEPKEKIEKILNFKNLFKINDNKFNSKKINKIKILYGNKEINIGDLFNVIIKENKKDFNVVTIRETNFFCDFLGYMWKRDKLIIKGDVGSYLGARMISGNIIVSGHAENYVGAEMRGGVLFLEKNAGNFVASSLPGKRLGMFGGEIYIFGDVKNYLCYQMRKGLVYVKGSAKEYTCNEMISGTVILGSVVGCFFAKFLKRGTIILLSKINLSSNFVNSSNCSSSFFNLINNHIQRRLKKKIISKKTVFYRYLGDINNEGKGEIFFLK